MSHHDVLVLLRPVVRDREVQHQVDLSHLPVQEGQSRVQVHRAGRMIVFRLAGIVPFCSGQPDPIHQQTWH